MKNLVHHLTMINVSYKAKSLVCHVRMVVIAAFALSLSVSAEQREAAAQTYPSHPIKIIVPFTAGGSNDVLGRTIAQKLQDIWGQPVVVENKPGASGNIGADLVAKSAADGYTLLIAANNILSINPTLNEGTPFDPVKDFAPIALVGAVPVLLAVTPSLPVKSVKDIIALGKAQPDKLAFGSAGYGSPQHLSADLFASMLIRFEHATPTG